MYVSASLALVGLLLLVPNVAFAVGFLQPTAALAVAAALALAMAPIVWRGDWRARPDWRFLAGCVAAALMFSVIGGQGHFFFQADDWTVRDALLADLVRNPWPPAYRVDGVDMTMRAPVGLFLGPALVGKMFGVPAADYALLAQSALLLGLIVYIFGMTVADGRHRWLTLGLFFAFSGIDVIPWAVEWIKGRDSTLAPHIEVWSGFFQFSSPMTVLFWAPHHGFAGWAFAAAYQVWRSGRMPALALCPMWALVVIWSPIAAVGAAPFIVFALAADAFGKRAGGTGVASLWRALAPRWFVPALAAAAGVLPILVYLTTDSAKVEKDWLLLQDGFLPSYVALVAFEILPFLALAWRGRDAGSTLARNELVLIGALLLVIPFYQIGFANDFASRGSIPALTILALRLAEAVARMWNARAAAPVDPALRKARIQMAAYLGLAAITPAVEIGRNLALDAPARSDCTYLDALRSSPFFDSPVGYYVGRADLFAPALFKQAEGAPIEWKRRKCWKYGERRFVYGYLKPEVVEAPMKAPETKP